VIRDVAVVRCREAAGGHTQLTVRRDPDVLDAVAFGWPELAGLVAPGDRLDLVARLASRRFGGLESLQLEVRDAATARAAMPVAVPIQVGTGVESAAAPAAAASGLSADPGMEPAGPGAARCRPG
jgi:hypothetical protein